eukprot:m.40137 g.40137  ORF g.40137 m.40137 type:complete len:186 (-) comp11340_c0_seq1:1696-2253(-)
MAASGAQNNLDDVRPRAGSDPSMMRRVPGSPRSRLSTEKLMQRKAALSGHSLLLDDPDGLISQLPASAADRRGSSPPVPAELRTKNLGRRKSKQRSSNCIFQDPDELVKALSMSNLCDHLDGGDDNDDEAPPPVPARTSLGREDAESLHYADPKTLFTHKASGTIPPARRVSVAHASLAFPSHNQ